MNYYELCHSINYYILYNKLKPNAARPGCAADVEKRSRAFGLKRVRRQRSGRSGGPCRKRRPRCRGGAETNGFNGFLDGVPCVFEGFQWISIVFLRVFHGFHMFSLVLKGFSWLSTLRSFKIGCQELPGGLQRPMGGSRPAGAGAGRLQPREIEARRRRGPKRASKGL